MVVRLGFFIILAMHVSVGVGQDKLLTNDDVVKMIEAGMGPAVILEVIRNSPGKYDTRVESMVALKERGVPDEIIAAMVIANSPAKASEKAGVSAEASSEGVPEEVGVYYVEKRSDELKFMEPEVVTWKTGGFWKSVATYGLTKGHLNGVVNDKTSRYVLDGDEDIIIYCAEGTSANEYQLLKLWEKKNRRTFRAVTGGIIHASSGADENLVPFDPVRVRPRLYRFNLPGLAPGEYGLLPPGATVSASAASMGKIYSFTIGR